ncbi:hypothetical protein Tco_1280629, partial [Tanacetum coccineum]
SDPDEDPEEDPEEDHADYPADGGDGDDEPFDDDDDDDTDDEDEEPFEDEDDDEEEEHLALPDSSTIPAIDPTRLCRARKTVRLEPPTSPSMEARIVEYADAPTPPSPPPSLLSPWSSLLPHIPLPPLPVSSPPLPLPSPPLGYRAARIQMRAASPPLLLPSTSHRTDTPEAEMPPRKRACFTTPAPGSWCYETARAYSGG